MRGEILFPVEASLFSFFSILFISLRLSSFFLRDTFCGLTELFHIYYRRDPSRQIQTRIFPNKTEEGKRKNFQGQHFVLSFKPKLLFPFVRFNLRKRLYHVKVHFVAVHTSVLWNVAEYAIYIPEDGLYYGQQCGIIKSRILFQD